MRYLIRLLMLLIATGGLAGGSAAIAADTPRVLIFTHSTGYRHTAIEPGAVALKALGEKSGYAMVESADPAVFSTAGLKEYDAIVFLSSTTKPTEPASEWFVGDRRDAIQAFVRRGGGIVGIHAATDSHYNWPWYGRLMGGWFVKHPKGTPEGMLKVVDAAHPSTKGLKAVKRVDEWYYFQDYNPEMRVLVTLDPASIGEKDANPKPMSWSHEFEGARVFYTALGHTAESYSDPWFLQHVAGGLEWVLAKK